MFSSRYAKRVLKNYNTNISAIDTYKNKTAYVKENFVLPTLLMIGIIKSLLCNPLLCVETKIYKNSQ